MRGNDADFRTEASKDAARGGKNCRLLGRPTAFLRGPQSQALPEAARLHAFHLTHANQRTENHAGCAQGVPEFWAAYAHTAAVSCLDGHASRRHGFSRGSHEVLTGFSHFDLQWVLTTGTTAAPGSYVGPVGAEFSVHGAPKRRKKGLKRGGQKGGSRGRIHQPQGHANRTIPPRFRADPRLQMPSASQLTYKSAVFWNLH